MTPLKMSRPQYYVAFGDLGEGLSRNTLDCTSIPLKDLDESIAVAISRVKVILQSLLTNQNPPLNPVHDRLERDRRTIKVIRGFWRKFNFHDGLHMAQVRISNIAAPMRSRRLLYSVLNNVDMTVQTQFSCFKISMY